MTTVIMTKVARSQYDHNDRRPLYIYELWCELFLGVIDVQEMRAFSKNKLEGKEMHDFFLKYDENQNGVLDKGEHTELLFSFL